jgi:hypothetical protein
MLLWFFLYPSREYSFYPHILASYALQILAVDERSSIIREKVIKYLELMYFLLNLRWNDQQQYCAVY